MSNSEYADSQQIITIAARKVTDLELGFLSELDAVCASNEPADVPLPSLEGDADKGILRELVREKRNAERHDARTNGFTAKANREINAYRKGEGRVAYNKKRRTEYAKEISEAEDRGVRAYMKSTPEIRAEQKKNAVSKHRKNRSPDKIAEDRLKDKERKANKAEAKKNAEREAMLKSSIF